MASKAITRAPALGEALDQLGIGFSRQGKRSQLLKSSLVDADDHDAIVVRARATQGKAQVQGAKLDVLEKKKAGATVAADAGKGKQQKPGDRHQHGQREIYLTG